ncbi:MAG: hypothetical protein DLM54_09420 [Acidimicrobiales bacterium]|nr:MAG: hypothetical protein DLM54_09420 [Acidimicrobiales bacterium]
MNSRSSATNLGQAHDRARSDEPSNQSEDPATFDHWVLRSCDAQVPLDHNGGPVGENTTRFPSVFWNFS